MRPSSEGTQDMPEQQPHGCTSAEVQEHKKHTGTTPAKVPGPGPGDYNITPPAIGQNGHAVRFGYPGLGRKYPPRTPDQPRAEIPCTYAEPAHVSCLNDQLTSDRATSYAVFFGGASRFQEKWSVSNQAKDLLHLAHAKPTGRPSSTVAAAGGSTTSTATPSGPGPGDYDVAHHAVGQNGPAITFGDPALGGKRYPPRTPDQPRAEVPCTYAEPGHISCLHHQLTSDRPTSPAVFFGGAPRFQQERRKTWEARIDVATQRKPAGQTGAKSSTLHPGNALPHASSTTGSRRRKKRRKRLWGGPRIFRRGNYGWLTSCAEPRQWEPQLKLLEDKGKGSGGHPATPTSDVSRTWSLTEKNAPRAVLRRGERHNQSEYNPQHRDLPREKDGYPGPKYDRPPGAFGRTGGGGGTVAPSASMSSLDRFPRGRLFSEEEMREREATPGPEAYDVGLENRLEGCSFEKMYGSLETLASWGSLGMSRAGAGACINGEIATDGEAGESENAIKLTSPAKRRSKSGDGGVEDEGYAKGRQSATELAKRNPFRRSRAPCVAGGGQSTLSSPAKMDTDSVRRSGNRRRQHCSRLSPASSVAAWRGVPCPDCASVEVATAAGTFAAASASLSDANLFRRARTIGASVRFGDMPRLRSAPAFTIGRGQRDVSSRLLHTTPAEALYKEDRLGRSGKGPTTASPRAGERLTRPRPIAARVVLPKQAPRASAKGGSEGGKSPAVAGEGGVEVADRGVVVVDGALGTQVKSRRPTSPSFTLAGPRRAATLFHERLRYDGKALSAEQQDQAQPRTFFNAHVPATNAGAE
ncbi:unnamed protein product [Ectocarpus fasciculatus]